MLQHTSAGQLAVTLVQEVAGLLQDQLQRSDPLITVIYCHQTGLLLQDAQSLDVFLRIVPLLMPKQQALVYNSFFQCVGKLVSAGR